jgi:hypothetical protein
MPVSNHPVQLVEECAMKRLTFLGPILVALALGAAAHAQVTYTATDVSGSTWQYNYTFTNNLASGNIGEVTVYYALGSYEGLSVASSPGNWSPLVAQPDPSLPADGFFDVQATDAGLASGNSVSGFAVDFTWLGAGTPGSQVFNIVNPAGISAAPEVDAGTAGAALTLLGGALLVLRGRRRAVRRPVAAAEIPHP